MSTLTAKPPIRRIAQAAAKRTASWTDWLERAWFASIAVYAFALPVWFFKPTGIAIGQWKSVLVVDALFAVSVLLGAVWAVASRELRLKPAVFLDAAFLLLAVIVPVLFSPEPRAGMPDLFRFGYSAALYVMVAHSRINHERLRLIAWLWVGAALIITGRSFLAMAVYETTGMRSPLLSFQGGQAYQQGNLAVRIQGTFANPNTFAPFLNTALVFALTLVQEYKGRRLARTAAIASAAVVFIGGLLTSSRGTAGLILTLGLVLWAWSASSRWRALIRVPSAAAMILAVAAVMVTSIWWIYPVHTARGADGRTHLQINTDRAPYYLFHAGALRMARAHPLTGVGPGRFEGQFKNYVSWEEVLPSFRWFADDEAGVRGRYAAGSDPHSTWFGWLARGGIAGMVLLLLFVGRAATRIASARDAVSWIALAGLAGVAFAGIYVEILHMRFIWLMLGVAMAWVTRDTTARALGGEA